MKYFVFHNDDYSDNGGIGLQEFATRTEVEEFLAKRLRFNPTNNLDVDERYTVIQGDRLSLKSVSIVERLEII